MVVEYKDIIGWWGAILSTILGTLAIRAKISRVKFHYETEWVFDHGINRDEPSVIVSIVNVSEKVILIRKIIVERYQAFNKIIPQNEKENYSEKLSQGEQYKYRMSLSSGNNSILIFDLNQIKKLPENPGEQYLTTVVNYPSKIRLKIIDTAGKSYKTKWFNLKKIKPKDDPNIIKW